MEESGPRLTLEQIAWARVVIQRWQARWRARESARFGRWDEAFRQLDESDRATLLELNTLNRSGRIDAARLIESIKSRKSDCDKRKWTLFKRHDGTEVKVQDVLEKVAHWVRRFERVGDIAVSFDSMHAALPWAGVKLLIEITIGDFEVYSKLADGLEITSRAIFQMAEVEKSLPVAELSGFRTEIARTVVDTYTIVLRFLAMAKKYFSHKDSGCFRWLKNVLQRLQNAVKDLVDGISPKIAEVYRLSTEIKLQAIDAQEEKRHREILSRLQEFSKHLMRPNVIQQQRDRIFKWLLPTFTDDAQMRALNSRHGTTCDWFLRHPKFAQWSHYQSSVAKLLWVHAPAGFGKSVLCATVIRSMQEDKACYGRVMFFHCSGQHKFRKHPFSILKSWIGQLVAKADDAVDMVTKDEFALQSMDCGTVTSEAEDSLWELFSKLMTRDARLTLVIDGYDECENAGPEQSKYDACTQPRRPYFIKKLADTIRGTGVRVLLVSRRHSDIEAALRKAHGVDFQALDFIEHEITEDDTKDDLSSYSKAIFESKVGKNKAVSDLASDAVSKSKGMFLWIALLNKNLQEGATRKELRKLVEKTPAEVYDAYKAELDKILDPKNHHIDRAVTIMKWILYASRPLTVREITEALAVTFNDEGEGYPHDDLPDDFAEASVSEKWVQNYIRMPCGSLVDVRKTCEDTPLGECTVEFVHFSVGEFLQQKQRCFKEPDRSHRTLCFGAPNTEHDWIATLCLRYMCYDEFDDASRNGPARAVTGFLQRYPFFSYTASNWCEHYARGKGSKTRSKTSEAVWRLFSTNSWRLWAELFEKHCHERSRDATEVTELALRPERGKSADSGYESLDADASEAESYIGSDANEFEAESNVGSDADESEYGSYLGGSEVEGSLITTLARKVPAISPSPVYYAAMLGLAEIIDRLVNDGKDCKLAGGELGCPLQAAVVYGQTAAVKALLAHKADPAQQGGKYGTPLIAAVLLGSVDILGQLVEAAKGGGLDAVDSEGKTALYHACAIGSLDMVTRLVQAGADTSIKAKRSRVRRSPLIRAVTLNHHPVVEFLLNNGADVNEQAWNKETPLMFAIRSAGVDMARLLLQHNADSNMPNKWGERALHIACQESSKPLVQLLLDQPKVDVEAGDDYGWSPLHFAAERNAPEVAQLLLSHGASFPQDDGSAPTPFQIAMRCRSRDVLELLVRQEFPRAEDTTILLEVLTLAGDSGYEDLLELLVEGLRQPALSGDLVRDIMELALKGESQCLFAGLVDHMRRDVKTVDDADVVDEQSLWSEEEAEIIRNSQWGATTQKDMVLHKIWGSYAKVDMVLVDAMLPVSVANRDSDIVSLLLKRGADVHRPVRFRGARRLDPSETITPLLMAILQDSRELVALMLESGRKARDGPKLLAAIETTAGRGGMRRTELTRMLIAHGALEGEAAEQQIESTGSGSEDKFSIRDAGEKSQDLAWWENALVGEWEGEYTYTHSWHGGVRYPTSFQVGGVASKKLLSVLDKDATLFDGGGSDTVDRFAIHGQVLSGNTVRFVKLYPPDSWMYEGSVDQAEGRWRMRGTWGLRFGRAHARGRFTLMKKKD